jgi:hypothetical protein
LQKAEAWWFFETVYGESMALNIQDTPEQFQNQSQKAARLEQVCNTWEIPTMLNGYKNR